MRKNKPTPGFSLIELLVVILIIGLGVSFISINVGDNSAYKLRTEAKNFANNTSLIGEEAVLSGKQWGVDLYREMTDDGEQFGYRWLVRSNEGEWQLSNDERRSNAVLFSPGVELRLQLDGFEEEQEILFKRDITTAETMLEAAQDNDREAIIDEDGSIVEEEPIEPAIWLLSSGELNPFVLTLFASDDSELQVEIEGDELGRIKVKSGEQDDEAFEDF